ncbi:hypothetical protein Bhyg_14258 [Pseudolycoriella hygida]|uniref:Uncharacterized protein n=1 Tax=Pseudolycoriella hygida TaxID=35572 RepID=A0A9Q0MPK9_9DIPT|nr:hypothetical protein Bhyg_14258 [Pseudolycoriella hygida]
MMVIDLKFISRIRCIFSVEIEQVIYHGTHKGLSMNNLVIDIFLSEMKRRFDDNCVVLLGVSEADEYCV